MQIDAYRLPPWNPTPRSMVAIMDATHTGDSWMLVVRDPHTQENVYAQEHLHETTFVYQEAKRALEARGFVITAIIGDG